MITKNINQIRVLPYNNRMLSDWFSTALQTKPQMRALAGVALHFSGGWMLMALAENWQQNRQACCSAKAREIGVLLAAQLVTGAGFEIGVSRVGLSAESGFLAYLLF